MHLARRMEEVMLKYADRPAIGEREKAFVRDASSSRTLLEYNPVYITITYRELWERIQGVAAELFHNHHHPLRPREKVAILGFTSGEYANLDLACIRLGATVIPLQTASSMSQLEAILAETEPVILAASIQYLEIAARLALRNRSVFRLIVFDYHPRVDEHREAFEAASALLREETGPHLSSLAEILESGANLPEADWPSESQADDRLSMLIYTSGSTGSPKGAMYTEKLASGMWGGAWSQIFSDEPTVNIHYMPMSHVAGHSSLKNTLSRGGACYFTAKSDLSSLFEDLALVRPTELSLVPRICEMIHQKFHGELARRMLAGGDEKSLDAEILEDMRTELLGGRVGWASCSSAPLSAELYRFMNKLLGIDLHNVYGSTEAGVIWVDGQLLRPPIVDYELLDVPELGYYRSDTPYPRGELLLKTESIISGYYKRPDLAEELFDQNGYYRTGDIVAEVGENHLIFVDRRKNVIKLSQGEFVATARLETVFAASPLVRQIFVHGKSEWSGLLAVVVPTPDALEQFRGNENELKRLVSESFREIAKTVELRPYEIPRDLVIESEPFSQANGLLSDHGKPLWPRIRSRYSEELEQIYATLISREIDQLKDIHRLKDTQKVIDTVQQAVRGIVGSPSIEIAPSARFQDLGGDSLSAVSLSTVLEEVFGVRVPIDMIVSRGYDLQKLADYIEEKRRSTVDRPTVASVHGVGATTFHATQLTLEKFLDTATISGASAPPRPAGAIRTVLLTGASGYLGRFLCLQLLRELAKVDGKLICVVRGKDAAAASERLASAFDTNDEHLTREYHRLASGHLEVLTGDMGDPRLGLDGATWERLAEDVDLIVHAGALVNHVLPYSHLFDANVLGTAELIGLALTGRKKPFVFVSSVAVAVPVEGRPALDERSDIRVALPSHSIDGSYASGYTTTKWAGEVLLREANSQFGLPVTVFRSSMILAHREYAGQLNVPDMFTRLLISILNSGTAPGTFYENDAANNAHRAHYDGLPVDFTASAIVTLGLNKSQGYETFNLVNPHDDGISLDTVVDWLAELGYPINRVDDYKIWFDRFKQALEALPDQERKHSLLPLIHGFDQPLEVVAGSPIPSNEFSSAVKRLRVDPRGKGIPHLTPSLIAKYVADLEDLDLIPPPVGPEIHHLPRREYSFDVV